MSDREELPEHLTALAPWLETHLPMAEAVELRGMRKASSGFSADTVMVDVAVTRAGIPNDERYVLRTESPEPPIYPVQVPGWAVEIELQYRIMDTLGRHADVPVAPMIGYEPDPRVLGTPFFVMGFVDGRVPVEDPPYTTAGFFLDVPPAERTLMIERGLATLARVHALDWRDAGLDWLVPPGTTPGLGAQLALWEEYYRVELRDREHPLVERAFAWLHAERPRCSPVGLCWGDPRPGNIIWRDAAPVCVTDFEAASIAPRSSTSAGGSCSTAPCTRVRGWRVPRGTRGATSNCACTRRRRGGRCPMSVGSRSARRPATARSSCGS